MVCSLTEIQKEEYAYYYTQKEITLNSSVGAEDSVGTIPAGEHIKSYFYSEYPDPHGKTIYIEHNGLKGWYTTDSTEVLQDYSSRTDYTAIVNTNTEVYSDISYEEYNFKFSNSVGTIPQRKEVRIIYETLDNYINYVYVEYDGITGWISDYMNVSTCKRGWNKEGVKLKEDCKVINIETLEETGEVLSAGEIFDVKYDFSLNHESPYISAYYLKNDNKSGWVSMTYKERTAKFETISTDPIIEYDNLPKVDVSGIVKSEEKADATEDLGIGNNVSTNNSANNQFRNCVLIAILIAIVAVVVIIILNKKRKK